MKIDQDNLKSIFHAGVLVVLLSQIAGTVFAQNTNQIIERDNLHSRVIKGDKNDNPFPRNELGDKTDTNCVSAEDVGFTAVNQFQALVEETVGEELPVFGREIFSDRVPHISTGNYFASRPDYLIGPGDQIHIKAWGQISLDYRAYVQKNGKLFVPQLGELEVSNILYKDLQNFIRSAVESVYKNFELSVSLGELKPVEILVLGHAKCPGSHRIDGPATFISALFATGGPSSSGTMRTIQLKRYNEIVRVFDLYDMLTEGDVSSDILMQSGDVIFIPPVGKQAAVYGGVNSPGIYEMDDQTSAKQLVGLAGGFSTLAAKKPLMLESVNRKSGRSISKLDISEGKKLSFINDGDILKVPIISPKISNVVTLKGNVTEVLRLPWRHNIKVSDLIPSTEMLITAEYWLKKNRGGISEFWLNNKKNELELREKLTLAKPIEEDIADLQALNRSQLLIPDSRDAENPTEPRLPKREILQSNTRPTELKKEKDSIQEKNALEILRESIEGAAVNWEYAVIERLNPDTLSVDLITFNLGKAIKEKDPAHDLLLLPGDVVTIFSAKNINQPIDKKLRLVRLEGEFNAPGIYPVSPGETLRDLVMRVGGITKNGYLYGAEFTRDSTKDIQQQQLDKSLNRLEAEIERSGAKKAATALSSDDALAASNLIDVQRNLLERLRRIKATGRVVLPIGPDSTVFDLPDMVMEDGDRFHVPVIPSTVSVFGAVYNQNSFVYQPNQTVKKYLNMAGGYTQSADASSAYLLRANGIVWSDQQIPWYRNSLTAFSLLPGDAIVVPEKLDAFSVSKELKDWSTIFYQFSLGVAGLKVLRDL